MDSVPKTTSSWLLLEEAAEYARVSRATFERELRAGRGPNGSRVGRRKLVFRVDDLETWIRSRALKQAGDA